MDILYCAMAPRTGNDIMAKLRLINLWLSQMKMDGEEWSGFVYNAYRFVYTDRPLKEIYKFTAYMMQRTNTIGNWKRRKDARELKTHKHYTKQNGQLLNAAYQTFDNTGREGEFSPTLSVLIRTDEYGDLQRIDTDISDDGSKYMLNLQYRLLGRKYIHLALVDVDPPRQVENKRWLAMRKSSTKGEHYAYNVGKSTFAERFRLREENNDDPYRLFLDRERSKAFRAFSVAQASLYASGVVFDAKYRLHNDKGSHVYQLMGRAGPWKRKYGRRRSE